MEVGPIPAFLSFRVQESACPHLPNFASNRVQKRLFAFHPFVQKVRELDLETKLTTFLNIFKIMEPTKQIEDILSKMIGEHVQVHLGERALKGPLLMDGTLYVVNSGKGGSCAFTEKSILAICAKRINIHLKP